MVLGIALVILISLVNINIQRMEMVKEIGGVGEAKMIGEMLATALNGAYSNGEGFSIRLDINYTSLSDEVALNLPIEINAAGRTIIVSRNTSTGKISFSIPIIPRNITREDPTPEFPETTIVNEGTQIVIYANNQNVEIT
jgi:hypothetical protein